MSANITNEIKNLTKFVDDKIKNKTADTYIVALLADTYYKMKNVT